MTSTNKPIITDHPLNSDIKFKNGRVVIYKSPVKIANHLPVALVCRCSLPGTLDAFSLTKCDVCHNSGIEPIPLGEIVCSIN